MAPPRRLRKLLKGILLAFLVLLLAFSAAITYIVRQRPQTIQAPCDAAISAGSVENLYRGPAEYAARSIRDDRQKYSGNILTAGYYNHTCRTHFVPTLRFLWERGSRLAFRWWIPPLYINNFHYYDHGFATIHELTFEYSERITWHIPPFANDDSVRLAIPAKNGAPGLLLAMPPDPNRLDMALHVDEDWASKSGAPMLLPPQGQHAPYVALACPSGVSLNKTIDAFADAARWLLHGAEIEYVDWLWHPAVQALLSQPTPVVAVFFRPSAPGAKAQLTLLFPDKRESWVMETLRTAQLDAALIPEKLGAWNGVVLPPSATAGAPLVGWLADCVAIAGTPQAFEALPAPPHFAPQPAPAAIGFAADGHLDTYNGVLLPDSPERIPGNWLLFTANPSIEAAVDNLIRPAELCEPSPPEEPRPFRMKGSPGKPYDAHFQIQSLLAVDKLYDALDLWQRWAPRSLEEEPGAVYAYHYCLDQFSNRMPLVTETAWCILNSCALYTAPEGGERVKEWGDFLVDWKRGPDAAPLSTIEESASQDDLYAVVVVWLGLQTATMWLYPDEDNVPEAWSQRLEELHTELSARLLQPAQCLTRRDYLLPLLRDTPGLSPAALDAIGRLPECTLSETRFLEPAELPRWMKEPSTERPPSAK